MTPFSPEAEAQMAAARARNPAHQFLHGEPARLSDRDPEPLFGSRFTAKTTGTIAELGTGMEAWCVEDGRRDFHGEPLGGIVLHVDPGAPDTVDGETGEIVKHPARFRCYDPLAPWPRQAFRLLAEDEIDPASIMVPSAGQLVRAVRKFCRLVGVNDRHILDGSEAQMVTDAARLVAVVMGGR